nr:unnamed protein product [Digitaria exilis]
MVAADRISALPDGILQHVLGFLQADEAVRTSVLAPCWRDLWRTMPVLRITRRRVFVQSIRRFMDHLFLLRDRSGLLDALLIDCVRHLEDDALNINLWIRARIAVPGQGGVHMSGVMSHCILLSCQTT